MEYGRKTVTGLSAAMLLVAPMMAQAQETGAAEIAAYQGEDRAAKLAECAQAEGMVSLYTANAGNQWQPVKAAFEAAHPGIVLEVFRAPSGDVLERLSLEREAGKAMVDLVDIDRLNIQSIKDWLVPFHSPELASFAPEALDPDGKFVVADANAFGFGYNTELLTGALPKTTEDLLTEEWKGKLGITSSTFGVHWMGAMLHLYGPEIVDRLGAQGILAQNASSSRVGEMLASGEVVASPTASLANIFQLKQAGAPLEWLPVDATISEGGLGILDNAPHPCAAMLYIDFILSVDGQRLQNIDQGYLSMRTDLPSDVLEGATLLSIETITPDYTASYGEWTRELDRMITGK